MPPKEPPVETTDFYELAISKQIKAAYEKGYADGYEAAFPKPGIFEACKREAVRIQAQTELDALTQIRAIMDKHQAEYGEKMPKQDERLLLEAWNRADGVRRSEAVAPKAPRQSRAPFQGEPNVEYEVVS